MRQTLFEHIVQVNGEPAKKVVVPAVIDGEAVQLYYVWYTPVTDRVNTDCVYGNPKGCIDQVLLNRLEANTDFVQYLLQLLGQWHIPATISEVAWQRQMYLYYEDVSRIQDNIAGLRASGVVSAGTPETVILEDSSLPTFEDINNWEECLLQLHNMLTATANLPQRRLNAFSLGESYLMQVLRR